MKLALTAILDESFRNEVKRAILDQAKAIAREHLDETIKKESERILAATDIKSRIEQAAEKALRSMMMTYWDSIKGMIDRHMEVAVKDRLQTLFPTTMDTKIRDIVRAELRAKFSGI